MGFAFEKIGRRDDAEELKKLIVLAPDYEKKLWNMVDFVSEGHPAKSVCDF